MDIVEADHIRARTTSAIVSGLAAALAFSGAGTAWLAWVCFVPLFYAVESQPFILVFGYAWLQGTVFFLGTLHWIPAAFSHIAQVPEVVPAIGLVILSTVLAIAGASAILINDLASRSIRLPSFLMIPIIWAAAEWIRASLPFGSPWALLGYAAYRDRSLIQLSELTGVYGISAVLMFCNAALYYSLRIRHDPRSSISCLGLLAVIVVCLHVLGARRIHYFERMSRAGSIRIAIIGSNFPAGAKLQSLSILRSFDYYYDQSELASPYQPDLICGRKRRLDSTCNRPICIRLLSPQTLFVEGGCWL